MEAHQAPCPWDSPGKNTGVGCHCLLHNKPGQHIKKQRHCFADKGLYSQSYGFSSSLGWDSWTIKKSEPWRIDAFELWYWRRLLRVNRSILKEINAEYSLEGLMLKLKLQHFGHLMRRTDSLERPWCWERWKAGGEGDHRGWDGWMASLTWWTWVWVSSGSWWRTGKPGMLQFIGLQRVRHNWATELKALRKCTSLTHFQEVTNKHTSWYVWV